MRKSVTVLEHEAMANLTLPIHWITRWLRAAFSSDDHRKKMEKSG
jgi:hypothetical protein